VVANIACNGFTIENVRLLPCARKKK